jgi:hypothetical protein
MPDITLYFLQASRCIRTAWQLEELDLDYKLEFTERENGKAPQHFKDNSGDALGKFPLIKDGDLIVGESGAIAEYISPHPQNKPCVFAPLLMATKDICVKNTIPRINSSLKIPPHESNVNDGSTQLKQHTLSTP